MYQEVQVYWVFIMSEKIGERVVTDDVSYTLPVSPITRGGGYDPTQQAERFNVPS